MQEFSRTPSTTKGNLLIFLGIPESANDDIID
jgi:hypothetical protein